MRVLVAGATGAIGRPLVRMLVEAGNEVAGITRSHAKVEGLRAVGVEPIVCDALDREALHGAVREARPDVVVNQLTDLPSVYDARRYGRLVEGTNRLRAESAGTLVQAAADAGARRVVAQSIAFAYAMEGGPVKSEDDPLLSEGPAAMVAGARSVAALERATTGNPEVEGVVLRYGQFYGPGTWFAPHGSIAEQVRRRRFPIVGGGDGMFSFIQIEDAAATTMIALDRGQPGIYNVCDDEPAPVREWLPVYARAIGAKPPRRVPWLARLVAGPEAVIGTTRLRGASNAKARAQLGFEPRWATWREGFEQALG